MTSARRGSARCSSVVAADLGGCAVQDQLTLGAGDRGPAGRVGGPRVACNVVGVHQVQRLLPASGLLGRPPGGKRRPGGSVDTGDDDRCARD